jgi:valyl-tRNA synthetase
MEIAKNFEFEKYEKNIYERWEKNECFKPAKSDKQYSIIMPPPNATGQLHLGHSIGLTIQDILLRYKRMQGYETLYVPGTDHAAIATESKVAALLSEKGIERNDLGRKKFLEEVDKFVKESQSTIIEQTKLMGVSADWSKIRYTMEEEISQQVSEIFINMYNDKLIYRDGRIVNWDAKMETTVSDDELEYVTKKDKFYYFQFGPVVIGTARPETKFKDEIIVVHPDDERYKELIGKEFELDWIEGKIKAKSNSRQMHRPKPWYGCNDNYTSPFTSRF